MYGFTKYVIPVISVVLLAFAIVHVYGRREVDQVAAPPIPAPRSSFSRSIAATGIVEPSTENVFVGAPVFGLVSEVCVHAGQQVGKDEQLFRLDGRSLRAELRVRQTALKLAEEKLELARRRPRPEEVPIVQARVQKAESHLRDRQDEAHRIEQLQNKSASTPREVMRCRESVESAKADLQQARAELALLTAGEWEPSLAVLRASVVTAQAAISLVEVNLERLTVRAPAAGEILQVNVHAGEFVSTLNQEPAIVMGDTRQLHVRVDIDELQIAHYRTDARAETATRGFGEFKYPLEFVRVEPYVVPKRALSGHIQQIIDTRVLQVIYRFKGEQQDLPYVGQQVEVYIEDERDAAS